MRLISGQIQGQGKLGPEGLVNGCHKHCGARGSEDREGASMMEIVGNDHCGQELSMDRVFKAGKGIHR